MSDLAAVITYDRVALVAQLKVDEAVRLLPYRDSKGHLTIGIGRNLDVGISLPEAEMLCGHDIDEAEAELDANAPWWRELSDARQRALLNLTFNMGWRTLGSFTTFLGLMKARNFAAAAVDLLGTAYAREVGQRAQRIAALVRDG